MPASSPFLSIVISGSEKDPTFPPAPAFAEVILSHCQGNVSRARNVGARRARGEWLLFLDEDCARSPDLYGRLRSLLVEGREDLIRGANYAPAVGSGVFATAYNWIQRAWVAHSRFGEEHRNLLGGFLLLRREKFLSLGGFDERIPWAGEETEFLRRACARGMKLELIVDFEIIHDRNLDAWGFYRRAALQGRNRGRLGLVTPAPDWRGFLSWMRRSDSWPTLKTTPAILSFMIISRVCSLLGRARAASFASGQALHVLSVKTPTLTIGHPAAATSVEPSFPAPSALP